VDVLLRWHLNLGNLVHWKLLSSPASEVVCVHCLRSFPSFLIPSEFPNYTILVTRPIEKYRIIDKRLPVFAKKKEKKERYYLTDNFLRAWLAAIAGPVSAMAFRPLEVVVRQADDRLRDLEGPALEKLVATLYEERSRKGVGDFRLTERVQGYWDRSDTEIDLVMMAGEDRTLRLVSCKRSPSKLLEDLPRFDGHVQRFLDAFPRFNDWKVEKLAIAPRCRDTRGRREQRLHPRGDRGSHAPARQ
jgi:hypothetical protein